MLACIASFHYCSQHVLPSMHCIISLLFLACTTSFYYCSQHPLHHLAIVPSTQCTISLLFLACIIPSIISQYCSISFLFQHPFLPFLLVSTLPLMTHIAYGNLIIFLHAEHHITVFSYSAFWPPYSFNKKIGIKHNTIRHTVSSQLFLKHTEKVGMEITQLWSVFRFIEFHTIIYSIPGYWYVCLYDRTLHSCDNFHHLIQWRNGIEWNENSNKSLSQPIVHFCSDSNNTSNSELNHLLGPLRSSNGKSSITEERLYSFFFAFKKKTKLRFFVFPLLLN